MSAILYPQLFTVKIVTELCDDDYNTIPIHLTTSNCFIFTQLYKIEKNRPGLCDCDNKNAAEYYGRDCGKTILFFCKILGLTLKVTASSHDLEEIDIVWKK